MQSQMLFHWQSVPQLFDILTDVHMIQPRGYIADFHIVIFPVAHNHHRCDIIACACGSNWHVKCSLVGG